MSLALATKGIIAGIGFGSGGGEGGLYPSDYIASVVEVTADMSELSVTVDTSPISITVAHEAIEITVETSEEE